VFADASAATHVHPPEVATTSPALDLLTWALRYSLELSPVPSCVHHRGVIRYCNPAFGRLVQWSEQIDLTGKRVGDILNRRIHRCAPVEPETLAAGSEDEREHAVLEVGGAQIDVEITSTLVRFESAVMVLSSFRRRTEERKRRFRARDAAVRFSRLMNSRFLGFVELGPERILSANKAFLNLVGRSRADVRRGELNWRTITPPEFWSQDDAFLEKCASGRECEPFEKEFYASDGKRIRVRVFFVHAVKQPALRAFCCVVDLCPQTKPQHALPTAVQQSTSMPTRGAGLADSINDRLTIISGSAALLLEDSAVAAVRGARVRLTDIIATAQEIDTLTGATARECRHKQAPDLPKVSEDPKRLSYVVDSFRGPAPTRELPEETPLQHTEFRALEPAPRLVEMRPAEPAAWLPPEFRFVMPGFKELRIEPHATGGSPVPRIVEVAPAPGRAALEIADWRPPAGRIVQPAGDLGLLGWDARAALKGSKSI
jgi:PAS domain S-box-containing protein